MDDEDRVFKALAHPARRRMLDLVRERPRTTGEVCAASGHSRVAGVQHLEVLKQAGLVVVRREGRRCWNYLNPVPIRAVYERWLRPFEAAWSSSLLALKRDVEKDPRRRTRRRTKTKNKGAKNR